MSTSKICVETQTELAHLSERLKGLSRREAELKTTAKRTARKEAREYKLLFDVAFVLYVLSHGESDCVEAYLENRAKSPNGESTEAVMLEIENKFAEMKMKELEDVQSMRSPLFTKSVYMQATKAKDEFRLVAWVKQQNQSKGVAPSTQMLCEEASLSDVPTASDSAGVPPAPAKSSSALVKWAQRFRQRWGLRLENHTRTKRSRRQNCKKRRLGKFEWRPQNGALVEPRRGQKGCHIMAPFLGPLKGIPQTWGSNSGTHFEAATRNFCKSRLLQCGPGGTVSSSSFRKGRKY